MAALRFSANNGSRSPRFVFQFWGNLTHEDGGHLIRISPTLNPRQPQHFRPGEGKTYTLGRITLTLKTCADDNAGAYTLCEALEPPRSGAGLHRHATYNETHLICEGRYEFQLGEKLLKLGPGDTVWVPRGTAHSIKCLGPETGRELLINSPGGIFDHFIAEVTVSTESESPSTSGPAMDFRAIAAKYGIEFLG